MRHDAMAGSMHDGFFVARSNDAAASSSVRS
jgi:hypothetical protein